MSFKCLFFPFFKLTLFKTGVKKQYLQKSAAVGDVHVGEQIIYVFHKAHLSDALVHVTSDAFSKGSFMPYCIIPLLHSDPADNNQISTCAPVVSYKFTHNGMLLTHCNKKNSFLVQL